MSDALRPHGLYSPWNYPGQNTGVGSFPFSRGFSQPGIEPRSPAWQADSLPAEPQGSLRTLKWVAYPLSSRSSRPRNWTRESCIAGGFFTHWAIRELSPSPKPQSQFPLPPLSSSPACERGRKCVCVLLWSFQIDWTGDSKSKGELTTTSFSSSHSKEPWGLPC